MLLKQVCSMGGSSMKSDADACNSEGSVALQLIEKVNSMDHMEGSLKAPSFNGVSGLLSDVVLQSMKDPVVMIDHDFRILWANRASTGSEAIGRSCYEEFQGRREPCAKCPVEAMFSSGNGSVVEKWIPLANGSGRWFEVRTYPVSNQNEQIVCAFRICFDVTHRRHTLEKQKKYIESLERAVKQMGRAAPQTSSLSRSSTNPHTRLSLREMEILKLVTEGFTNSEIAHMLSLSAHTVKSHVIHVFNKLGVADRTQAAVQAIRLGIIR